MRRAQEKPEYEMYPLMAKSCHGNCPGGTWCDCQHRSGTYRSPGSRDGKEEKHSEGWPAKATGPPC